MPDGIFLTPVSGLHYVLHVFDQTEVILTVAQKDSDAKISTVQEAVRHHDDRLVYLENRHDRLSTHHDLKVAINAEINDWMLNRSEEDWFTVMGLPRLTCSRREWPEAARKQVNRLIQQVLDINQSDLEGRILVVSNPLAHRTTGMTVYNVKLSSVDASKTFRGMFSGFFKQHSPVKLPSALRGVQVRNKVTLQTRVRISILTQLGVNYKAANPGSSFKVRGFGPRPLLDITPASGSSGSSQPAYPRKFNFIEAVRSLSSALSDDNLARIFQIIGNHNEGELRQLFVIISDDDRARGLELVKQALSRRDRGRPSASVSTSGVVRQPGSGMDVESGLISSIRSPPPPPPPDQSAEKPESKRKKTVKIREASRSRSPSPVKPRSSKVREASRSRSRTPTPARDRSRSTKGKENKVTRSRSPSPDRDRRGQRGRDSSSEEDDADRRKKRRHLSSDDDDDRRHKRSKKSRRHRRRSSSSSSSSSGSSRAHRKHEK